MMMESSVVMDVFQLQSGRKQLNENRTQKANILHIPLSAWSMLWLKCVIIMKNLFTSKLLLEFPGQ